jgi:hypothetical protein
MIFHHIGYVVNDINRFEMSLIFEKKINRIFDEIQYADLALYKNYSDVYIELIQPYGEKSHTWNTLMKNGNHYHHLCYSINSKDLEFLVAKYRLIEVLKPVPAILFENQYVTFYINRNKQLIEFLIS